MKAHGSHAFGTIPCGFAKNSFDSLPSTWLFRRAADSSTLQAQGQAGLPMVGNSEQDFENGS